MINTDCVELYNEVSNQVRDQAWAHGLQAWWQVRNKIRYQPWHQISRKVRKQVWYEVWYD
jgi:hypothetical protein